MLEDAQCGVGRSQARELTGRSGKPAVLVLQGRRVGGRLGIFGRGLGRAPRMKIPRGSAGENREDRRVSSHVLSPWLKAAGTGTIVNVTVCQANASAATAQRSLQPWSFLSYFSSVHGGQSISPIPRADWFDCRSVCISSASPGYQAESASIVEYLAGKDARRITAQISAVRPSGGICCRQIFAVSNKRNPVMCEFDGAMLLTAIEGSRKRDHVQRPENAAPNMKITAKIPRLISGTRLTAIARRYDCLR